MSNGIGRKLNEQAQSSEHRRWNVATAGSVIGAILASSCCIAPLVLITLGLSGAWIGNLTALRAYQAVFVPITIAFLAFGFWQVYGKSNQVCDDESYCANPTYIRTMKTVLWIATALIAAALSVDLWAPIFY